MDPYLKARIRPVLQSRWSNKIVCPKLEQTSTRAVDPDPHVSKFSQAPLFFYTFVQSVTGMLQKTLHKVIFTKFFKARSGYAFQ